MRRQRNKLNKFREKQFIALIKKEGQTLKILKKISKLFSADLLKYLYEMGHGDEIAIVDANFPAASCKAKHMVMANGISSTALLDALLDLFPIDTFVPQPVKLMKVVEGDPYIPIVWKEYERILHKYSIGQDQVQYLERYDYYADCDKSFCVVSTGERLRYGNLILRKGIIEPD